MFSPAHEAARKSDAFARVLARAREVWAEPAAQIWLESPNGFLAGARPIDVLVVRGEQEVLDALDATAAGGYA